MPKPLVAVVLSISALSGVTSAAEVRAPNPGLLRDTSVVVTCPTNLKMTIPTHNTATVDNGAKVSVTPAGFTDSHLNDTLGSYNYNSTMPLKFIGHMNNALNAIQCDYSLDGTLNTPSISFVRYCKSVQSMGPNEARCTPQ